MKRYLPFIASLFVMVFAFAGRSSAQLTIAPGATASMLASQLTGAGVLVLNPVLTCPDNAQGIFSGVSTLGFNSGIVLTSGQAATAGTAIGAGGPASSFASTGNGTPGDPSLDLLSGATTYDACVLEFDFRPAGDTIKFNYVFGSEEYNGFTCTGFNDVFGFIISGPGFTSPTNIALVPGTTIPVCINSVNCGPGTGTGTLSTCTAIGPGSPFCSYYVNNLTGTTITYDGLTSTLTAIAAVTPCDTYHLKIGIADATDDIWDSGVFLEAHTLSSVNTSIAPVSSNPADTSFGGPFCIRGCYPGDFTFNLSAPTTTPQIIHYVIGGTAVNGYDYTHIPDSVIIPPGSTSATVTIQGLTVPAGGTKTVTLYILATHSCSTTVDILDSATVLIVDSPTVQITTPDTAICLGQSLNINAVGNPLLSYQWTPTATLTSGSTSLTTSATPTVTTTYTLTGVYTLLGCPPVSDQVTVTITHLDVMIRDTMLCVGQYAPINANTTPVDPSATYLWGPAGDFNDPTLTQPIFYQNTIGDYAITVTATNSIGCAGTATGVVHVMPLATINITPGNTTIGLGQQVQLDAINTTPYPLFYFWTPADGSLDNPNINNPIATPLDTTTYIVYAMNEWGCRDSARVTISVDNGTSEVIPTAFTPNGDGLNDVFRILNMRYQKLVAFEVYNRWGQLVYQNDNTNDASKGWDGTFNGVMQDLGVYNYLIIVARPDGTQKIYKGDVTLIK